MYHRLELNFETLMLVSHVHHANLLGSCRVSSCLLAFHYHDTELDWLGNCMSLLEF